MELSRTYTPGFAGLLSFSTGIAGTPVNKGAILACVLQEDGAYARWRLNESIPPFASLAWTINYDSAIPSGATITSFDCYYRYAGATVADLQAKVWSGFPSPVEAGVFLPLPTTAAGDDEPKAEDMVEATGAVTEDGFGQPFTVSGLQTNAYAFEWTVGPDHAPPGTWYVDRCELTVRFTLPTPTSITAPTFHAVKRNSIGARGNISLPAGALSVEYPLTCWFEYTKMDPTADGFDDAGLGQGKVEGSDKQLITGVVSDASRTVSVSGEITDLAPGSTYYVRLATSTAGSDETFGPWASITTPTFDDRASF